MAVDMFIHTFGDFHIYGNHIEQVKELLSREWPECPQLVFNRKVDDLFDFDPSDYKIVGYNPLDKIAAPVAV